MGGRNKIAQSTAEIFRHALRTVVREWGLMQSHPCIPELTLVQGHALIELDLRGPLTVAGLAHALRLEHSSASRLVARLIERRYVREEQSSTDRREKVLSITASGKKGLAKVHEQSNRRVFDSLEPLSDSQRETVLEGMRLYAKALRHARSRCDVKLRPIRKKDNRAVASIIRTVMPEFGADGPGFAIHDKEVDAMYAAYSKPRHGYFVLDRRGMVVGGGGIAPLAGADPSVCELRKMYLLPEARGCGLGELLLQNCLMAAKQARFETCYLETTSQMVQAQSLYQKMGFRPLKAPRGATGHCGCDRWYELDLRKRNYR